MKLSKKLENFWYHHKFGTIVAVLFIAVAVFLVADYFNKTTYDITIAYAGSDYVDSVTFNSLKDDIEKISGDINGDGKTNIMYLTMVLKEKMLTETDFAEKDQFNYSFLNSSIRVYILEERFIDERSIFFMPLDDILPAEKLENGYIRDQKTIAVPLAGNETLEKLGFTTDKLYIGIRAKSHNDERDKLIDKKIDASIRILEYFVNLK